MTVGIFIDEGYLLRVLKESFGSSRIDYSKLSAYLADGSRILRTYYYTAMPYRGEQPTKSEQERYDNKQRFLDSLRRQNSYEVRLGKLQKQYTASGQVIYRQKRVDALLTLDLVCLAIKQRIDKAVIVSADSDFIPAIERAKDEGVQVELVYEQNHLPNSDLLLAVDFRKELTIDVIQNLQ